MNATGTQSPTPGPDWQQVATGLDLLLPQLAPASRRLLDALAPKPGERLLDLACGTGEPALTLARHHPGTEVIATDAAPAMAAITAAKAEREALPNVGSCCARAEQLPFAENSFDGACCRFGVMLFTEPNRALNEIARVVRPGGRFVFCVWRGEGGMTTLEWAHRAFAPLLPAERHPPLALATSLGRRGCIEQLAATTPFRLAAVEHARLDYRFENFDHYWETMEASGLMSRQLEVLDRENRRRARKTMEEMAKRWQRPEGLVIPHHYLVATAVNEKRERADPTR